MFQDGFVFSFHLGRQGIGSKPTTVREEDKETKSHTLRPSLASTHFNIPLQTHSTFF